MRNRHFHAAALCVSLVTAGLSAALMAGQQAQGGPLWPDAAEIETFLREAKITERTKIGTGITNPEKVTLELDGVTRQAVLKQVERTYDSWGAEVAAYELDKLLRLGHVPPTVPRTVRGRRGCLQLWVDGNTLTKLPGKPGDLETWRREVSMMWLFDDLTANNDRHLNNAIVTSDFRLAFIDNSKSFRDERKLLNNLDSGAAGTHARYWMASVPSPPYPVSYRPELIERLRTLTDQEIRDAVKRHVSGLAVQRLLERRRLIVKRLDERRGTP